MLTPSLLQWPSVSGDVPKLLAALADSFAKVRVLLKRMGDAAGVPIEPDDQTRLADATVALPGVVLAGVPGGKSGVAFVPQARRPHTNARAQPVVTTPCLRSFSTRRKSALGLRSCGLPGQREFSAPQRQRPTFHTVVPSLRSGALCPLLLMEGAACSPTTEPPSGDGVRMDNVPK